LVAVSITEMVAPLLLVTYAEAPSGVIATEEAPATGTVATTVFVAVLITETELPSPSVT